ncbi:MAG: DMT family transporter [Planctomycetota bacterium]|nr:MAG: DMT family transporter [Planctomycetota bacterium]REK21501.1 MAG: DMT family transporter [Planctomycetota bacterium]REK34338.1 MAG: DMT family transporter [Planctomycetota bacterium]
MEQTLHPQQALQGETSSLTAFVPRYGLIAAETTRRLSGAALPQHGPLSRIEHALRRMARFATHMQMVAAILLFGTALPVSRILTAEVSVPLGIALRTAIATLVFLPFLWAKRGELQSLERGDWVVSLLVGCSLLAVSGLMLCSTRLAPCSAICAVTSLTPVVTAIGAIIIFRDRPRLRQLLWILAAAASSLILRFLCTRSTDALQELEWLALGIAFSVLAICCEAGGILLCKFATHRLDPLTLAALSTGLAAIVAVPLAWAHAGGDHWLQLSPRAALAALWWGAGGLALGTSLWYRALASTTATTAAAFLSALPFVTFGLSWLMQ